MSDEIEVVDEVKEFLTPALRVNIGVGVVALAIGAGIGYFLGRKRGTVVWEMTPDQEKRIEKMYDDAVEALGEYSAEGESALESEEEVILDLSEARPHKVIIDVEELDRDRKDHPVDQEIEDESEDEPEETEEETTTNVFELSQPENLPEPVKADSWSYPIEMAKRSADKPYVIHRDEFYENELGFSQLSLTYYAGDDILAVTSEEDQPMHNYHTVVGELRFGHGSEHEDMLYVRNHKNRAEYEITRVDGLYSQEVMGLEIENNERARDLKHADRPGRFRDN